jgi:anhydro-N-acetylmuramic acid kinase
MPALKIFPDLKPIHILGLMSGTSCDGLDIAMVETRGAALQTRFKVRATQSIAYGAELTDQLLHFISKKEHSLKEISQFNFFMARTWAGQIEHFLKKYNIDKGHIDLIASHGQTLWHQPDPENFLNEKISSTLQLGDPAVLANLLNIPVVGNFRVADMALGGQGAPLIPYFDWVFFARFKKNILALNIGGISNITYIPADGSFEKVTAFDCGPGNMLIDGAMQLLYNKPFDADGAVAASGKNAGMLLNHIKGLDIFAKIKPPKSTGRELYNLNFIRDITRFAKKENIGAADIIHTITRYTALAIFEGYKNFVKHKIDALAIAGGGAKNSFLQKMLREYFGEIAVNPTSFYGLDEDFKEAIGFAILANETIRGNTSNVPSATGARGKTILGTICWVQKF